MPLEAAVRDADVVVTATSSREPILKGEWLKKGAHVNAVGAARRDWRELDDAVMANVVVVDSYQGARSESGGVILRGITPYAELGEILNGSKSPRARGTTVFKSLVLGGQDRAPAHVA